MPAKYALVEFKHQSMHVVESCSSWGFHCLRNFYCTDWPSITGLQNQQTNLNQSIRTVLISLEHTL